MVYVLVGFKPYCTQPGLKSQCSCICVYYLRLKSVVTVCKELDIERADTRAVTSWRWGVVVVVVVAALSCLLASCV